jgi:hypothetical protein
VAISGSVGLLDCLHEPPSLEQLKRNLAKLTSVEIEAAREEVSVIATVQFLSRYEDDDIMYACDDLVCYG